MAAAAGAEQVPVENPTCLDHRRWPRPIQPEEVVVVGESTQDNHSFESTTRDITRLLWPIPMDR